MRRFVSILLIVYTFASAATVAAIFLGAQIPSIIIILLTILAFGFALFHGSLSLGWKWTLVFVGLTFLVSLFFETIGVATGLIYGPYHYTNQLGPQFLGLVPYIIPLAWFMMMYPSWVIAVRIVPKGFGFWRQALVVSAVGSLIMTAWDLAMDPLMVEAGHWVWEVKGDYFGVPLQNYWGWWLTSFITMLIFILVYRAGTHQVPTSETGKADNLPVYSYTTTGLSSILTNLNLGLGGPALAGLFAMVPWILTAIFQDQD